MSEARELLPAFESSTSSARRAPDFLPPDLSARAVRRLGVIAGLAPVPGLFFLLLANVWPGTAFAIVDIGIMAPFIVLSTLLSFAARLHWLSNVTILRLGRVYEVGGGLLVGFMINDAPWPDRFTLPSWSPIASWVLVFALVVPARTLPTAVAATLTAAMDPFSLWLLRHFSGAPLPSDEAMIPGGAASVSSKRARREALEKGR